MGEKEGPFTSHEKWLDPRKQQTQSSAGHSPHTGHTILSTHTPHAITQLLMSGMSSASCPSFRRYLARAMPCSTFSTSPAGSASHFLARSKAATACGRGGHRGGNASLAWQPHDSWRARLGGSVEGWGIGHAAFARAAPARCVPAAVSSSSALDPRANVTSSSTGQRRRLAARQLAQGWACCPPCTPRRGCTARSHPACASPGPALPAAPRPRCPQGRATV